DGTVWTEEQGDFAIQWLANEGVRVCRVLALLREARLPPEHARLRDGLLSGAARRDRPPVVTKPAEPRPPAIQPPLYRAEGAPLTGGPVRIEQGAAGSAGAVTMTIPLHVTVALGAAPGAPALPTVAPTRGAPPVTPPVVTEWQFGAAGYVPSSYSDRFSAAS